MTDACSSTSTSRPFGRAISTSSTSKPRPSTFTTSAFMAGASLRQFGPIGPTVSFYPSNTWKVSNGITTFALFRRGRGGAALRSRGGAATYRAAGAVAADPGFGEGDRISPVRPIAAWRSIERRGETVLERRATNLGRRRRGEATRRTGGPWSSRYASNRHRHGGVLAWLGRQCVSQIQTSAPTPGTHASPHGVGSPS